MKKNGIVFFYSIIVAVYAALSLILTVEKNSVFWTGFGFVVVSIAIMGLITATATIYSKTMHMSKKGIYDQLTSEYGEKFPADAAQYAIDNMSANWNENALQKAKTYQKSMNMSKSAIYDQLISDYGEKFTKEEAQYAIDHLDD